MKPTFVLLVAALAFRIVTVTQADQGVITPTEAVNVVHAPSSAVSPAASGPVTPVPAGRFAAEEYMPTDPAAAAASPGTEITLANALSANALSAQSVANVSKAEVEAFAAQVAAAGPIERYVLHHDEAINKAAASRQAVLMLVMLIS